MRDILFRGKRTDNGEWVYGLLCRVGDTYANIRRMDTAVLYSVLTNTIGQFTGLTDKNGRKIFEGDIFTDGVLTWQVSFKDGAFGACFGGEFSPIVLLRGIVDDEVIGNIHDNPELFGNSEQLEVTT